MSTTATTATAAPAVPLRDDYPQFPAVVTRVADPAPAYRRVTLHAPALATLARTGPDEVVGLYLPRPGRRLVLPEPADDPRAAVAALDDAVRPDLRWYTIRSHQRDRATIEVDVVHTDHGGPGARWVSRVGPGDPVGVRVCTAPYGAAPAAGHHLLLADESALPAVVAVVEDVRARTLDGAPAPRLTVLVEAPDRRFDHPDLRDLGLGLLHRGDRAPGSALLEALPGVLRDAGPVDHAWVCAEGGAAARLRGLVVRAGVPREGVYHCGFWSLGRPRP